MNLNNIKVDYVQYLTPGGGNDNEGFIQLSTISDGSIYKDKGEAVFGNISKYKFKYQRNASSWGKNNDLRYFMACSFILITIFEEFMDKVHQANVSTNFLEEKIKSILETIGKIPSSTSGIYSEVDKMITYGIGKTIYRDNGYPGDIFLETYANNKASMQESLLYNLLYFSIYNLGEYGGFNSSGGLKEKEKPFKEWIIERNFKQFNAYKAHKEEYDIEDGTPFYLKILPKLGDFVKELLDEIEVILNILIKDQKLEEVELIVNENYYTIFCDSEEEANILKKIKDSYSEIALTDYGEYVADKKNDEAKEVEKSLLDLNYNYIYDGENGYVEPDDTPSYSCFASKWMYYMYYQADENSFKNKLRSTKQKNERIVRAIYSYNNLLNYEALTGRLKEDIKAELENEAKKALQATTGPIIGEIGLVDINKKFNKKIYSESERNILGQINFYWEDLKKEFAKNVKEGNKKYSDYLKGAATGENVNSNEDPPWVKEHDIFLRGSKGIEAKIDEEALYFYNLKVNESGGGVLDQYVNDIKTDYLINLNNQFKAYNGYERFEYYNILDLFYYFCFYDYESISEIGYSLFKFKAFEPEKTPASNNITNFKEERKSFREGLRLDIIRVLTEIEGSINGNLGNEEGSKKQQKLLAVYTENELELLKNKSEVEEFFYVGGKYIPIGKKVDIEFQVYDKYFKNSKYISVSKKTGKSVPIGDYYVYEDNYFSSFVLKDEGGIKEVTLILKSKDETNLEDIIYNSIIGPINRYNLDSSGESTSYRNDINEIYDVIKNKEVHFKMRFGYTDNYGESIGLAGTSGENCVNDDNLAGDEFRKRTKKEGHKPVKMSPWISFMIKELSSRTINEEMVYEISAISVSTDAINNFSIFSPNPSRLVVNGNPYTVVGWVGNILKEASNGRICLIGKGNNKIVYKKQPNSADILEEKIYLENSATEVEGTLNELPEEWTVEKIEDYGTSGSERTFDLSIESAKKENGMLNIKDILDSLMKWLPKKMYIVKEVKTESKIEKTAEVYDPIKHKSLLEESKNNKDKNNKISIVSLSPSYDIVEVSAKIEGEKDFNNKTIIRISYKGPKPETDETKLNKDAIRKYSFKHKQNTVVKNLTINNEVGLNNVKEYCSIIGTGLDKFFLYSSGYDLNVNKESDYPKISGAEPVTQVSNNTIIVVPKKNYLSIPKKIKEGISEEEINNYLKGISNDHMVNMETYAFTGVLEILGDPYYLSDDKLEFYKSRIFLDVNRMNKNGVGDIDNFIKRSYYTGIYFITGIEHEMNSDGEFTTRLSIHKDTTT